MSGTIAVVLAYAVMVTIWGTTWLGIKYSLEGMPPMTGVGARFLVAGTFLYAMAFAWRVPVLRQAPPWRLVFVLALMLFGGNYVLTYVAETHLASGLVAVLFGTLPFFVFAFGRLFLGERYGIATVAGAVLALGGVALISLAGDLRADVLYAAAAIAAALSSAFANVYLKRHAASEPLIVLPPAMLVSGIAVMAAGLAFERTDWHAALAPASLAALAYLALFGSGIAFFLNHWLLQRLASWIVGLSALMIPVIAVVVGAVAGGERLTLREGAGALLVIAGVALALARKPQLERYEQLVEEPF